MPSPDDKVTLIEISRETGIAHKTISHWFNNKRIKRRGVMKLGEGTPGAQGRPRKGRPVIWVYWKDVVEFLKNYRPGGTKAEDRIAATPPGHIHADEAACLLGVSAASVRGGVREGRLEGQLVPMNGANSRHYVFVSRAAVDKIVAEREAQSKNKYHSYDPPPDTSNPLITANDAVCLEARRRLWEEKGRVFPRKLRIYVAEERMAG